MAEWAGLYRAPFSLVLTGPAGGGFRQSEDVPFDERGDADGVDDLDAIEFCRILSGRATGSGVLADPLPL